MSIDFTPEPVQRPDGTWDMHEDAPRLNVSNHNARLLLERLGLPWNGWGGAVDADDFLGRALVANVGRDDSGTPAAEYENSTVDLGGIAVECGYVVDCGLRAGYFDDRMTALVEVAQAAKTLGVRVQWS